MIYLACVSAAAILFLGAAVVVLLTNQAQERREWVQERSGLVNLCTQGIPLLRPSDLHNQKLPTSVEPPPDAAELNLVGQVIPINGDKDTSDKS